MSNPLLSIIIPTYNRPHLLLSAVQSALEQTIDDFEVVVVDDASPDPVNLPEHPRLRIVRQLANRGVVVARNVGAKSARGRWITYLDDDDRLLPHMAQVSLDALTNTTLPSPVALLSGMEVVDGDGNVIQTRLPPTLPRGKHFFLEEIKPGLSFLSKQTLVVERKVLLSIGGYDETLKTREHTEMFLRLNPVCSILGLPIVTYRQLRHSDPRLSRDPSRRQVDFDRLIRKHESLFRSHPKTFANFVYEHAMMSYSVGQQQAALLHIAWAMKIAPLKTLSLIASPWSNKLMYWRQQL
jgi:glycosyltransferase involved in cell wall biosynthesis